MTPRLPDKEISAQLIDFIRSRFLAGDSAGELDESSPLLEWGIINSLNTTILIAFINEQFGTLVSLEKIDASTFKSVRSMTAMIGDTAIQPAGI